MKPLLLKAITAALQAGQIAVEELTQTAKRKELKVSLTFQSRPHAHRAHQEGPEKFPALGETLEFSAPRDQKEFSKTP